MFYSLLLTILTCSSARRLGAVQEANQTELDHDYISIPLDIGLSQFTTEVVQHIVGLGVKKLGLITCPTCLLHLRSSTPPPFRLTSIKNKGGLIHPSNVIIKICKNAKWGNRG